MGGGVFYSPSNHLIQVKNLTLKDHKPEFVSYPATIPSAVLVQSKSSPSLLWSSKNEDNCSWLSLLSL